MQESKFLKRLYSSKKQQWIDVSKSVTASTQRIPFPYQLVCHFFSTSDTYLIVCCHTHLNIQIQTQACTTCVMGRTCHQKLLSATFWYITLQMSLSAGGWMKDLRVCACVFLCRRTRICDRVTLWLLLKRENVWTQLFVFLRARLFCNADVASTHPHNESAPLAVPPCTVTLDGIWRVHWIRTQHHIVGWVKKEQKKVCRTVLQ